MMREFVEIPVMERPYAKRLNSVSRALRAIDAGQLRKTEDRLIVVPVRNAEEMDCVYRITHDAYVARGYCPPQPDGRLIHYPHLDGIRETVVLVAILDGEVVGTNSLTLDGPSGLQVDRDFKKECDAIRAEKRKLAVTWRIATREFLRSETSVVMALIQETARLALRAGVETCVFTLNPRHERIYQRLMNMVTVATRTESVAGLSNAPAVFMRMDMAQTPERWLDSPELRAIVERLREKHVPAHAVA